MRIVVIVSLFASFAVAYGCKDQQEKAEEAMAKAKEAQKEALEAARAAEKAATKAAAEAAEAAEAAGDAAGEVNPKDVQEAMAEMQKALQANASNVEPIDFRELKKLLPEKVGDLSRKGSGKGEKTGAMGMKISKAEARYEGGDGASADVSVVDMGSMKGFAAMAATGWAMAEIDRETDDGYEKTTKIDGHKAFEKWDGKSKRGEVKLIVGDRFLVEVKGRKIEMEALKAAVDALDLDALEKMKSDGVK